ncbi:MAG: phosphodiester glycosidase family protein [Erysipelotrichaceae bacterium]|nr:phosphodiester glycosidase family protein [Erysipelotrichaceae bacterium]
MSEKKSRVSRYQRLHVGVDEFKKQQVVNKESIHRLHEMAQKVTTEDVIVDVNKKASTNGDMKVMETFVQGVNESKKHIQNHEPAIFIVEEENIFDEVEEVVEDEILVEEEKEETVKVDELSVTEVLNNLKETLDVEEPIIEVVETVEPEVEEMVTVETNETVDQQEVVDVEETEVVEEIKPTTKVKKSKKERWNNFCLGFFTFCNVCALICFFVAYGPFHQIRDLFVTTAMRTMTKKYLANVLYSTETIQEVLATNVTIEPNEVMDSSAISIGNLQEPEVYSSIYEEQVLKRDEGNDLYKVIRLDEDGYKGYITFVYDPTTIQLAVTKKLGTIGQFVTSFAKDYNAVVAINGGGFIDVGGMGSGGQPTGYVIKNGKIVWSRQRGKSWGGGTIGFNKEGVLILTKKQGKKALEEGIYNGVDFGPFLIVNGKSAEVSGNGGWGVHPRTVIGQRKDGIVVFLTVDGRSTKSLGIDLNTAIEIMERYDVYNAANLDGGASTVLAVEGKLMNKPVAYSASGEREVPTAWVVVPHATGE